jgi:hypothetical protein
MAIFNMNLCVSMVPGEGRFFLTVPYATHGGVTKMAMAGAPDRSNLCHLAEAVAVLTLR